MVKVAAVVPAKMVTFAGTCATAGLLLCNVTTAPLEGATPFNVTVPVEFLLPTILVGFTVNEESAGGFTVRVAVRVVPYVPEIVTGVEVATAVVVTLKVALVAPAPTVTLDPTCAEGSLLESVTVAPP